MAIRWAVASGNWSNTATWDGGTLPTAVDDVYADGKTVTIDQNVTVLSINNLQRTGGTIAGTFVISQSGLTITANIFACGNLTFSTAVTVNATGTTTIIGNITGNINTPTNAVGVGLTINFGTVNVTGNVQGGGLGGSNNNGSHGISVLGSSILNLTGNVQGGASSSGTNGISCSNTSRVIINGNLTGGTNGVGLGVGSTLNNAASITGNAISGVNSSAITNASTGTVTINTSQTAAGTAGVYMITNSSTGIVNINGDCLGALSSTPSNALILNNSSTGIVNISGSVTARSVSPSTTNGIVNNTGTGTINVGGNVSGGSVANTIGMGNPSFGTINVTGNITGGSHATNTPAIYSTQAGTIDVTGSATAGLYPALFSTSVTANNILRGNITNALGVPAFFTFKTTISPTAVQTHTIQDTGNVDRLFSTSNVSVGAPPVTDVRAGIVYGSLNELTGTMIVPTPANVRNGVLTDNTVGTADLTISEFWDYDVNLLNQPSSIGARLKNCSTVETTGDQLAAF